jgi:hypothetical protein
VPVVAVGSNAAPSQLVRKFATRSVRPLIPVTLSDVSNLVPGVSAHVSKPGYIPAVPVKVPGAASRLSVLWLDNVQLRILDETEPNYRRLRLPAESFPVRLESGVALSKCSLYVGKHGCLVDTRGQPRRLTDQWTLIQELLDESPLLRKLCGESPEEFVARVQNSKTREAVRRTFATEGKVAAQSDLTQLPESLSADALIGSGTSPRAPPVRPRPRPSASPRRPRARPPRPPRRPVIRPGRSPTSHLEISAEVLIERRAFVARGRDGGHPWLILSSDLARFERALTAAD